MFISRPGISAAKAKLPPLPVNVRALHRLEEIAERAGIASEMAAVVLDFRSYVSSFGRAGARVPRSELRPETLPQLNEREAAAIVAIGEAASQRMEQMRNSEFCDLHQELRNRYPAFEADCIALTLQCARAGCRHLSPRKIRKLGLEIVRMSGASIESIDKIRRFSRYSEGITLKNLRSFRQFESSTNPSALDAFHTFATGCGRRFSSAELKSLTSVTQHCPALLPLITARNKISDRLNASELANIAQLAKDAEAAEALSVCNEFERDLGLVESRDIQQFLRIADPKLFLLNLSELSEELTAAGINPDKALEHLYPETANRGRSYNIRRLIDELGTES